MCREFFRGLYIMLLKKEIYPGLRGAVLLFGQNSVRFFDETALAANTYKNAPPASFLNAPLSSRAFLRFPYIFLRTFCKATAYNYLRKWVRP